MNSLTQFLQMGGYGTYVWSAYGITLVIMVLAIVIPLRQHSGTRKRLARQFSRKSQ